MASPSHPDCDDSADDYRASAEVDDSADDPADWTVLPPTLRVEGDVAEELEDAVESAIEAEPNAVDGPKLWAAEEYHNGPPDRHVAVVAASFNEQPAGNGEWLPAYRSREDFGRALREELPDGYDYEEATKCRLVVFEAGVGR